MIVAAGLLCASGPTAVAQMDALGIDGRYTLAETVQLDRAEGEVATHLQRVKACLADRQWDEAVQTLRQVMENFGDKLWPVTERRFITVRDYCQLQLALLPPPALALYRARVDSSARQSYEQGIAKHDRKALVSVVRQTLASSWGDNALLALGEMALESGDPAGARAHWEKILPVTLPPDATSVWRGYPDSDIDPAAVRARLVLASILEGSLDRAKEELTEFKRLHPAAHGRFGGRDVNYAEALAAMLAESRKWPELKVDGDWPTFAGTPWRNKTAPETVDVGEVAWRVPLEAVPGESVERANPNARSASPPRRTDAGLSFHPIRLGNLVLVNQRSAILALDLRTGKPAWGSSAEAYRDEETQTRPVPEFSFGTIGTPRYTMTAANGRLYARMGDPVTARSRDATPPESGGCIVCLDLEAEGRLVWKVNSPRDGWAFEGSPVADGENVYVAMRRGDIQPQAHVACYDAETGEMRWRRFICAAETPARGTLAECTHNLLTLKNDTLYYNTNLGAVAAIACDDGQVQWVSLYPRALDGNLLQPEPRMGRDLTPCLYDRGTLLIAPSDSRRIFAMDAANGQILWQTGSEVDDAVHLLGVSGDQLIVSGSRLYWIGLDREHQGRVRHMWPQADAGPGFGRGLLAGDRVYWPSHDKVYEFDQATGELKKVIELGPKKAAGGNLLVAAGHLLIATENELIALTRAARTPVTPRNSGAISMSGGTP